MQKVIITMHGDALGQCIKNGSCKCVHFANGIWQY